MTPFEAACLVACIDDSRCPDLAKCCAHDCGITCMHPINLDSRNGKLCIFFVLLTLYVLYVPYRTSQQIFTIVDKNCKKKNKEFFKN